MAKPSTATQAPTIITVTPSSLTEPATNAAAMIQNQPTASPKESHQASGAPPAPLQTHETRSSLLSSQLGRKAPQPTPPSTMIFSDFYKSPRSPLSKLRMHHPQLLSHHHSSTPEWVSDEYADLLSRDKAKQKDALKRYLLDKVRNDWTFDWPPTAPEWKPGPVAHQSSTIITGAKADAALVVKEDNHEREDSAELDGTDFGVDDDAGSVYSVFSEDTARFQPRSEWTSDLSDDNDSNVTANSSGLLFDHSDAVQSTGQEIGEARKARRRRALREEMSWNNGLACFEARRNAWTNAKTVRLRGKPVITLPVSPKSPRRFFFRRSLSGSPPSPTLAVLIHHVDNTTAISDTSSVSKGLTKNLNKHRSIDSSASDSSHRQIYPVETLLPIAQPILPPTNPLRASICPTVYTSLYDKVIIHNLHPACPINLSDMLRSCVAGWKRDGEWPPRSSAPEPITIARRKKRVTSSANEQSGKAARRMSFGLLGRENPDDSGAGKGIRRSLQRALGIEP